MLQFRGITRTELGDPAGLDELREGVRLGRELGLGYETAVGYSNLGELLGLEQGPAEGLLVVDEALEFSEQRGLGFVAALTKSTRSRLLFMSGVWDKAICDADEVLRLAKGAAYMCLDPLMVRAEIYVNRGEVAQAAAVIEDLLPLGRRIGDLQALAPALTVGALVEIALENRSRAAELVAEIENATRNNAVWRGRVAADFVRVCVRTGDLRLAESMLASSDTRGQHRHNTILSARAALAEATGEHERGAALYAKAAQLWAEYGHALEQGHGLFGAGRCYVAVGRHHDAVPKLEEAHAIFVRLGARPLLEAVEAQLAYA